MKRRLALNLTAALILCVVLVGAAVAAQETLIYGGDAKSAPTPIALGAWGSGTFQEVPDLQFEGTSSIKLTSQGDFQGGRIWFQKPLDIATYAGQPNAYVEVWLRPYYARPKPTETTTTTTTTTEAGVQPGTTTTTTRTTTPSSRVRSGGLRLGGGSSSRFGRSGLGTTGRTGTGRLGTGGAYGGTRGTYGGVSGRYGGTRGGYQSGVGGMRGGYQSGLGGARSGYGGVSGRYGGTRSGYQGGYGGARGGYQSGLGGARSGYQSGLGGARSGYGGVSGRYGGTRGGYQSGLGGVRGRSGTYGSRLGGTGTRSGSSLGRGTSRTGIYSGRMQTGTQTRVEEKKPEEPVQTGPAPVNEAAFRTDAFRVELTTDQGTAVLPDYPIYPGDRNEAGWVRVGFPLRDFKGRIGDKLSQIAIFAERPDTVYIGEVKLLLNIAPLEANPIAYPAIAKVGQPVTFMARANEGLAPIRAVWDFDQANGLQEEATGSRVTTVYNKPGDYEATVTMSDATGANPETKAYVVLVRVK